MEQGGSYLVKPHGEPAGAGEQFPLSRTSCVSGVSISSLALRPDQYCWTKLSPLLRRICLSPPQPQMETIPGRGQTEPLLGNGLRICWLDGEICARETPVRFYPGAAHRQSAPAYGTPQRAGRKPP